MNIGAQGFTADSIVKMLPFAIVGGVAIIAALAVSQRQ